MRILLAIVLSLFFCGTVFAASPMRQGTILIDKFESRGYKTSNPIDVKKDIIDFISDQLQQELKTKFENDSKLVPADSCNPTGFRISGKVAKVDSKEQRQFRGGIIRVYTIYIEGTLSRCNGDKIQSFSVDKEEDDIQEVIEKLADKIVNEVRKGES